MDRLAEEFTSKVIRLIIVIIIAIPVGLGTLRYLVKTLKILVQIDAVYERKKNSRRHEPSFSTEILKYLIICKTIGTTGLIPK
jgi:hypothetical protein